VLVRAAVTLVLPRIPGGADKVILIDVHSTDNAAQTA